MSHLPVPLYGFAIFFLIFWCGTWCVHLLAICYAKYRLHKKSCKLPSESPLPGVSILKPLMGVDPNLQHNLETFFTMDYPLYELLFCVEDKSDPAIKVVELLISKYPHINASLFIGGCNVGVNPKINNMQPGYLAAKHELLLISDSGIKMKADTLLDMVQNMGEKYALVHQMPFTADREGFAATFEKVFFGTVQSRIYLSADLLGINCHTGMSCLLRKSVIDALGGLRSFGCYLAEDFFIAKAVIDAGWRMRISSQPALQNSGICDISTFQQRLIRWAKLRVAMVPTTILLEPLSECMILGSFAAWSASLLFKWDPLVFYLVHVLCWFLSDWVLLSIVQHGSLPFHKFEFVIGWLFRELSGPYLFLHALWNPAIRWRTRTYKLAWGGVAYELPESMNSASQYLFKPQNPPYQYEHNSLSNIKATTKSQQLNSTSSNITSSSMSTQLATGTTTTSSHHQLIHLNKLNTTNTDTMNALASSCTTNTTNNNLKSSSISNKISNSSCSSSGSGGGSGVGSNLNNSFLNNSLKLSKSLASANSSTSTSSTCSNLSSSASSCLLNKNLQSCTTNMDLSSTMRLLQPS